MRRREFITLLGGAAAAVWPLAARAQQSERLRRIGVLRFSKQEEIVINSLLRGLQMLGYVDGKSVVIEYRDPEGNYERFSKEIRPRLKQKGKE
jgi:putative ABC transport system substrate-binding protein